jgi:hypothetical protein
MKKKKLQLKELKVKSFITVVNKEEQRTAKGGYVYRPGIVAAVNEVASTEITGPWTSEKTRATSSDNVLSSFGNKNISQF